MRLIDADALWLEMIDKMRLAVTGQSCSFEDICKICRNIILDAPTANQWIKCSDRMPCISNRALFYGPEDDETVTGYIDKVNQCGNYATGYCQNKMNCHDCDNAVIETVLAFDGSYHDLSIATHWMPLPKPPMPNETL